MLLLSLSDTLFYLFSLLAIASAFVVVTTPNPVHAVLFLVSSFAGAGCLLVLFGAEAISTKIAKRNSAKEIRQNFRGNL